jgi:hypothetical protein
MSTSLPRIEPIVPTVRTLAFNDAQWIFEAKYDGFPGVVYLSPEETLIEPPALFA